ncbi:hypothetical protein G7Y89_g11591 [Cudoniella acicularis]|uniref:Uncharacterized protein n=1 Tax=Cudoniella acicularis TaxID=354080 RepID=A0A8H4RAL0_9HELO|nr:hypothetical protein G7Y89_g11591 [Cudoniella acicularis]
MLLVAFLNVLLVVAVAGTTTNQFIFPSPQDFNHADVDGSFAVGAVINILWETTWETVTLVIWQDGPLPFQYLPNSQQLVNATSFIWTVNLSGSGGNPQYNLRAGETFFFGLFQTGTQNIFESQFINITGNAVASPISSSTTAVQSSTASSIYSNPSFSNTSITPTSGSQTPSASPSSSQSAGEGSSTTNKTGLGVGLGMGLGAVIAGLGAGYFLYRRKRASAVEAPPSSEHPQEGPEVGQVVEASQETPKTQPHELEPAEQQAIYELFTPQ